VAAVPIGLSLTLRRIIKKIHLYHNASMQLKLSVSSDCPAPHTCILRGRR
jgi:hypothetical protein